jgi:hypothetical protein
MLLDRLFPVLTQHETWEQPSNSLSRSSGFCIFPLLGHNKGLGAVQLKNGDRHFSVQVSPWLRPCVWPRTSPCAVLFFLLLGCMSTRSAPSFAQSPSENTDSIRGVVINSATREPVARALVYSPDNRFATLTNSEGRFEFTVAKADSAADGGADSNPASSGGVPSGTLNRPYVLLARKPGYNSEHNIPSQNLQNGTSQELTLTLTPESLIVGTVTLPTSEAPDSITLQIFRQQVQDGRAHWIASGGTQSTSDGQFRFAELMAGTYKLVTHELLDLDPVNVDSLLSDPRAPLFGYPPVYYQNAPDFDAATTIQVAPGQTQTVNLSLVKQHYYRVKVPVVTPTNASGSDGLGAENGLTVEVYAHGRAGPGFSLGFNAADHAIEGMLPSGSYTVEALSPGVTGLQTITIKDAPINGPSITLLPNTSIPVNVKEEFTSTDNTGSTTWTINGRNTIIKGPRRYLNVTLEPADDFNAGQQRSLRDPTRAGDDALAIEGAPAGVYWVRVQSSRGYPASVRSGDLDLEHQPLIVAVGGASSPIEITMRDDTAEISGTVEGVTSPAQTNLPANGAGDATAYSFSTAQAGAHIYCIPLPDGAGRFTEIVVNPDGSFVSQALAPGAYRVLAFDHELPDLEYKNPDAMRAFDSKGPVVRVSGGQKEHIQLQVIPMTNSGSGP